MDSGDGCFVWWFGGGAWPLVEGGFCTLTTSIPIVKDLWMWFLGTGVLGHPVDLFRVFGLGGDV